MIESSDRIDQFRSEIAHLKLKTGKSNRDTTFQTLGVLLMIAGIVLAFIAYEASRNVKVTTTSVDLLNASSYGPLAVTGLAISVVGGFVFLRYSLANFLRFWLLRQSYEQRAAIDEIVNRPADRPQLGSETPDPAQTRPLPASPARG